jgi:hypothetical protein
VGAQRIPLLRRLPDFRSVVGGILLDEYGYSWSLLLVLILVFALGFDFDFDSEKLSFRTK